MLGSNTNISTPAEDFQGWVQGPDTRGSLDIIWSCVAVLVTALWTVLHVNLPGKDDGLGHLIMRKFRWGCASILAPDFLTLVAASQWDAAKKSAAKMREVKEVENDNSRWCMEHAFYANSGGKSYSDVPISFQGPRLRMLIDPSGFLLRCPDVDAFPIDADTIHYLVRREYIKLPTITRDEVWDKSKAALFAKAATVIQSGWLIISSIGRKASNLPICPMETFTLAFVVSTVMSYFFWWRKPQNVETPTVLVCEHTMAHIRHDAGLDEHSWEKYPTEFVGLEDRKWRRRAVFEKACRGSGAQSPDVEDNHTSVPMTPTILVPGEHEDIAGTKSCKSSSKSVPIRVDSDSTVVPEISERQLPSRIYNDSILPAGLSPSVLLSAFIPSVAHSAIHLLGWNFQYPTYAEKQLWRAAAVVLISMGAISSVGIRVLTQSGFKGQFNLVFIWVNNSLRQPTNEKNTSTRIRNSSLGRIWRNIEIWDLFLTFTTVCLLLARFAIITEVIISFRSLPRDVFVTVNWSDFLPHV